jgi:hypothetical protein
MADVRITCIRKQDPGSIHEHITHVGNPAGNWMWPREKVIKSIEIGTNTFFILDPSNRRSEVGVVYPKDGRQPYLRSYADGAWNDNLLAQIQCPSGLRDL